MVAVATAAKIVTAAPAGVEGVPAVVKVATAATNTGLEAANTAVSATEAVQRGVKAAEVGAKAAEVTPEAVRAAEMIDDALAAGEAAPEQAMNHLVNSPIDARTAVQVVEGKSVDTTLSIQRQEEIQHAVQLQMAEWDKSNPPGIDIQKWIEQRAAAEKQFTVNEGVNRDLAEWKKQNPPPDKEKNPEAYAEWEKRLAERERVSHKMNEASYDQLLREQETKRRGMSREEFMRRYAQLQQLRARADQIKINIQNLRASPYYNETLKAALGHSEATLNALQAEITNISVELQLDAVVSGDNWKNFILPAFGSLTMVAGQMEASANEPT